MLQRMKLHPLFREILESGEMVEWGAKTIPEGGYYALPKRRHGDGLMIVGDSAGFVEVASLKGIHYAMQSGMFAARAAFDALEAQGPRQASVSRKEYDTMVDGSFIVRTFTAGATCDWLFREQLLRRRHQGRTDDITGGVLPAE